MCAYALNYIGNVFCLKDLVYKVSRKKHTNNNISISNISSSSILNERERNKRTPLGY